MQWYALVSLLILIIWAISVKSILAFSFFAVVSFILAQNLLDSRAELDLFKLFGSKSIKNGKSNKIDVKPFPQALVGRKRTLIKYILRDFVISWFENVGIGDKFIVETRTVLEEATETLYEKMVVADVSSYTNNLCISLHKHFIAFEAARNQELFQYTSEVNFQAVYKCFQKRSEIPKQGELKYLKTVVDLLLQKLVKKQTLNCNAGRFILREILAVNLLLPILNTLSDPYFLNRSIINIFGETKSESDNCGEEAECFHSTDSILMSCLDDLYSDTNDRNDVFSGGSDHDTSSVKYKFKNTTVIEHEYNELVEISMEACPESKNKPNTLLNGLNEDCSNMMHKTVPCKENTWNQNGNIETKHSSANLVHTLLGKVEFNIDNKNTFQCKENSSKPLEIFGVKIQPGGFVFGRNLKRFHPPSVIKQFGVKKCLDEIQSQQNNDDYIPKNLDTSHTTQSSLPTNLEPVSDIKCTKNRSLSDSSISDTKVNKGSISSSFEDIDNQICCNKDNREQSEGEEEYDSENRTREIVANENILFIESETSTDDSFSPQSYKRLSSSGEDWDTDVFENFITNDGDFLKAYTNEVSVDLEGKQCESVPSDLVEFPSLENPCLLINILSTELIADGTWEPHKSKYTVYHISYSNKLWSNNDKVEDHDETSNANCEENNTIKRRYREFMELHHRLCNGPYASCLKDVPKPNRKFNSPFFRLDEDVIEGRQTLLETYLKGLVTHPNILNGDEFKGFLGIGDESQTTFRRQMIVPAVPRIDKKLHKKVTKIIDHIKTAFETGTIDGDKEEEYDIRQVLGEDKSPDDIRTFAICSSGCRLSHSCCYSGKQFQKFVQDKLKEGSNGASKVKTKTKKHTTDYKQKMSSQESCLRVPEAEQRNVTSKNNDYSVEEQSFPLTETIFNLSCELLQDQESWICLDPVQQAATTVFGCLFEWWFASLLGELITEEQWVHYLTLLKMTVWPCGKLMDYSDEESTKEDKEQAKEDAIQILSDFFGGVLHFTIGSDAIKTSARNIVESLQCEEINRQLLLEILEVTLVEIFPEIVCEQENNVH